MLDRGPNKGHKLFTLYQLIDVKLLTPYWCNYWYGKNMKMAKNRQKFSTMLIQGLWCPSRGHTLFFLCHDWIFRAGKCTTSYFWSIYSISCTWKWLKVEKTLSNAHSGPAMLVGALVALLDVTFCYFWPQNRTPQAKKRVICFLSPSIPMWR